MGDALKTTETVSKSIYKLTLPTNWVEVSKAFRWAARDYVEEHGKDACDDQIQVSSEDDETLLIWWKYEKGHTP